MLRRGRADRVGGRRLRTRGYGNVGELREDRSQPGWLSNLFRDHSEKLFVVIFVSLEELLRERLARRRRNNRVKLALYLCLLLLSVIFRPHSEELAHFPRVPVAEAHRDASRVDEEIKLDTTEETDPIRPFHFCAFASVVDGARREGIWGKREASAS